MATGRRRNVDARGRRRRSQRAATTARARRPARARHLGSRPVLERELKFSPGPSFTLPDLNDDDAGLHADAPVATKLVASYFDTPDLRLARAGASLRHRN